MTADDNRKYLLPDSLSVDSIKEDFEIIKVAFNENIRKTKSFKRVKKGDSIEFPIGFLRFLIENDHCSAVKNEFHDNIDDIDADPLYVNLSGSYFYKKNSILLKSDIEKKKLKEMFFARMGYFAKFMLADEIPQNILRILSNEEKEILLDCKKRFDDFNNEFFN